MANSTYLGNSLLKNVDVKIPWTKEQVQEYIKCQNDPIYFIKKYIKIIHVDKGLVPFDLYPFQEKAVKTLHNKRFIIGMWPRQTGKCLLRNVNIKLINKKTPKDVTSLAIGSLFLLCKYKRLPVCLGVCINNIILTYDRTKTMLSNLWNTKSKIFKSSCEIGP